MMRYLAFLLALLVSQTVWGFCPALMDPETNSAPPVASCGQASGSIIVGQSSHTANSGAKAAGSINVSSFSGLYDCSIDELVVRLTGLSSTESCVVGIYDDTDEDDTASLLEQSSEFSGNVGGTAETFANSITSEPIVSGREYFLVVHCDGAMTIRYVSSQPSTVGTKTISGTYSSTLPPTIDVSSMITTYSYMFYGTNP